MAMKMPSSAVELLQDLIALPSVSPDGDPGTRHTGEEAVAQYTAGFMRALGAEVRVQEVRKGRPNTVAAFEPEGEAEAHLAVAPHSDTVSVEGMTISPFDPVIRHGRIYGRGSSDTKGPMAAAMWALKEWAGSSARRQSRVRWTFAALMGEEEGSTGAAALCEEGFRADFVMALEPTQCKVVYAHKGALWLSVGTRGRSCHGSTPHEGVNAVYAMRPVIELIEKKLCGHVASRRHPVLGPASLNLGTIRGGSKINIVPGHCTIELDVRTHPDFNNEAAIALLDKELKAVSDSCRLRVIRSAPPMLTDRENRWVKALGSVASGFDTATWFCDGSVFSSHGMPSVAFGPGSIAQAHTRDEFISLDDFEQGVETFRKVLALG